jgi:hypothetical protein
MTKTELKQTIKKAGNYVYVVHKSVSSSGMTRKINLYIKMKGSPSMRMINRDFCEVTGWSMDKDGRVIVHGCGMDMHFHTVYTLSSVLFGHKNDGGYKLKYESL